MRINNVLVVLVSILFLASCRQAADNTENQAMPTDIIGLKKLLATKKSEAKDLNKSIADIEAKLLELDPALRKEAAKTVVIKPLEKSNFEHYVSVQGAVVSDQMANIVSEMPGRLIRLTVDEGDWVSKGQVVGEIDMTSMVKQREEVEKGLELANQVFQRQSKLWDQKIGSEIQYLQAKNNKERLEKSLQTIDYNISKSKIISPISGSVEMVIIQQGELASPGMPIAKVMNTSNLVAKADVPETFLRAVKRGQKVKVKFPSIEQELDARVRRIARTIDATNRTFSIECKVPSKRGLIKPNLLTEIEFMDYELKDVIQVPLDLILKEVGGKYFVKVAEEGPDGYLVKKKYVTLGESSSTDAIIESGLTLEDKLITEGSFDVSEGELIKIQENTDDK